LKGGRQGDDMVIVKDLLRDNAILKKGI